MSDARRKLLRALTLGGGAVTLSQLPTTWSKPAIDSVVLPAHAQTTMNPLSGSQTILFQDDAVHGGQFAHRERGQQWLDHLLPTAHAGLGPSSGNVQAYAEPMPGSGNFLVQLLFLERLSEGIQDLGDNHPGSEPSSPLLESLVPSAHAQPDGCYLAALYQTTVTVNIEQSDGYFGSAASPLLSPTEQCGEGLLFFNVSLRLQGMQNPTNPTFGNLEWRNPKDAKFVIPIASGGSRLSADCMGMPCNLGGPE